MANTTKKTIPWLPTLFGAMLIAGFFLPWVNWGGKTVSGSDFPTGNFFKLTESQFGLSNPTPGLSFTFYIFWLIPVLAAVAAWQGFRESKNNWPAWITGVMTLGLVTVYFLITAEEQGYTLKTIGMFSVGTYLVKLGALGLIWTSRTNWLKKIGFTLIGPVFAYAGFMMIQHKIMSETFQDSASAKADYTISAPALIKEFMASDSSANKKYREKIIEVSGSPSEVKVTSDSTVNITFADSTGSFAIFSFTGTDAAPAKKLQTGTTVSVKGSCSGSIYSDILGTTSITFKRCSVVLKK